MISSSICGTQGFPADTAMVYFGGSMAVRDEIRELVLRSFLEIVRCNERNLPLDLSDLAKLESHLNWELSGDSIRRWAGELPVPLSAEDVDFLVQMFQHCWEHYTEDLKELKQFVGEDASSER